MNRKEFRDNLLCALSEKNINGEEQNYIITPVIEKGKKYNSLDDYMRLTLFTKENLNGRTLDLESVVKIFASLEPYFPLWIDIYILEKNIVELRTSLRFRKPSELSRKETGHPPFKIMNENTAAVFPNEDM